MQPSTSPHDMSSSRQSCEIPPARFCDWKTYRCAYEVYGPETSSLPPLLLIHPIGVGLARSFWHRFCQKWQELEPNRAIYSPDLLGCGESDMPTLAYRPLDWAEQLQHFTSTVIQQPAIVITQGALMSVALELGGLPDADSLVKAHIWSGPPAWSIVSKPAVEWQQQLAWRFFRSPLGNGFYRYARRKAFLDSFSQQKLFAEPGAVDREWLSLLHAGSRDMASRHAVFAFLAGFWRQDYRPQLSSLSQPTFVTFGDSASSISRTGQVEPASERLRDYLDCLPHGSGCITPGRNVLPYENTHDFVTAISSFIQEIA
ncbi:MAG: alpha/beta hydrolase [Cyanobacteria bacterium P01_G01_bin.4]